MTYGNFFRQEIEDLTANTSKTITEINADFRARVNEEPCNFLHVVNKANNPIIIELNSDSNESFHVEGNGGTFIINIEDKILYSSLRIVEEDGNTVTGKIKVTGAVL